jgi:hypothetical protein
LVQWEKFKLESSQRDVLVREVEFVRKKDLSLMGGLPRGVISCFNAFSRVDVRVDVKIPGGVDAYVVDLRGERYVERDGNRVQLEHS